MPLIEHFAMAFGVGVPFIGLIVAIVFSWGVGIGARDIALLLGFYAFTILGVTIGFHRMFTHRALKGTPGLRLILA
ncbi:MAG TPA: hypothetical protein VFW23_11460, partial [Tepidisphaeraceae bacterium]|nr:hypothetical protein [Tepidisphaeraceae bacterium]